MINSKRHHYPQQGGSYAVKVKNGAGWRNFTTARLHISVGQPYHEGEKFRATIDWLKHRFDRVIICVNDTLQRHNFIRDGLTEKAAFERAAENGQQWIVRNMAVMNTLPHVEIHRWEHWREDPNYAAMFEKVTTKYHRESPIKQAFDEDVMMFWTRHQQAHEQEHSPSLSAFKTHSTRYLLEECAAFSLMFEQNEAVDIYAGSVMLPCRLFKNDKPSKDGFTRIDFVRRL